eukprot:749773-Hanusia_phi.AAC.6
MGREEGKNKRADQSRKSPRTCEGCRPGRIAAKYQTLVTEGFKSGVVSSFKQRAAERETEPQLLRTWNKRCPCDLHIGTSVTGRVGGSLLPIEIYSCNI